MGTAKRRGMATRDCCALSTVSHACMSCDRSGAGPACLSFISRSTALHSNTANKNVGRDRLVGGYARVGIGKPEFQHFLRVGVRRQCEGGGGHAEINARTDRTAAACRYDFAPNPERNNFKHSSNSRAGGTPSSRYASARIGRSVRGLNGKIEFRREPHCAQHAHRILAIAGLRIADQLETPRLDIAHAIDEIPDREILDVVVKPVGGEIAPPNVLFDGAVDVVAQNASRLIEGPMLGIAGRRKLSRSPITPASASVIRLLRRPRARAPPRREKSPPR